MITLEKLQQYAKTRGTKLLASRIAEDGKSAGFVLESGPKLTMTEAELAQALAEHAPAKASDEPAQAPVKKGKAK